MTLTVGSQLGPFEIVEFCAAGGMGEVYRARDKRLNRDVALKVLPAGYLQDPERMARFRREAQLLAVLNHPNIAAIHGFEEAPGINALVMEFVEGPTLHEIIAAAPTGPGASGTGGLGISEAIGIARQIADALEAAHEHGIVHRDLKPSNVKVRPDGTVKVLDFGLARTLDVASGSGPLSPTPALENSPTVTSPVQLYGQDGTAPGVILGTAAYMSPEQARGKPVDKRADIWAFGVVLYEMVTGRRLFRGDHVTDVLAAVVRDTPDLTAAPPSLRRLLEKCLEKDPRKRLRDISSVSLLLDDAAAPAPPAPVNRSGWSGANVRRIAAVAVVVLTVAGLAAFYGLRRSDIGDPESIEFAVSAPPGTRLLNTSWGAAVAPDGQHIVFSTQPAAYERTQRNVDTVPTLWVRSLGSSDVRQLHGTEGATGPIWAPDSKSIAFQVGRKLMRSEIAGGTPIKIADLKAVEPSDSGTWNAGGTILLACPCGLERVTVATGETKVIVPAHQSQEVFGSPQFLPDGDRFLFFLRHKDAKVRGIYASSLSRPESRTLILNTSAKGTYVPPLNGGAGHLLTMEGQTLLARTFDVASLRITGEPVKVAEGLELSPPPPERPAFWASGSLLLHAPAVLPAFAKRQLVWMDREGAHRGEVIPEGPYNAIDLSPDGRRVAVTRWGIPRSAESNGDIWLWDFARATMTRFTFDPAVDENPLWSPDSQQIAYSSRRDGAFYQVYRKNASGTGEDERLTNVGAHTDPLAWSPDGRFIVYRQMNRGTGWDLMLLPLEGDRKPVTLLQTPESDSAARFSPDGKWLAYHSRLNGRTSEVYVQAFAGAAGFTGDRIQVSNDGGIAPRWRGDGRELVYFTIEGKVMSVNIQLGPVARVERPRELFTSNGVTEAIHFYDLADDGKRLIMVQKPRAPEPVRLTVVTNWQRRILTATR